MGKRKAGDDEMVSVLVPQRLLPAVSRLLMEERAAEASRGMTAAPRTGKQNLIDLIIPVALGIGADRHPVSLAELHRAYLQAYPGIGKGVSRGSFDATANYHCINMRSRFPEPNAPRKPAYWLTQPVFKRVGFGQYMLLSEEELARFRRCCEVDDPLVYAAEYDVDDLGGGPAGTT